MPFSAFLEPAKKIFFLLHSSPIRVIMFLIEYSEWFKFLKIRWFAEDPRKIWSNPSVIAEDEISMIPGLGLPN
jgi:hypothetical protein